MKSKENLIPAKRTNPDSNYAYAQEMEEDSVQQVENCLEDATLLTLQKAGAAYKDRIACKRELHKPHQEGSLYRNTLEPREKETVVREPSKTNPQGTSKQEQQRCTAQKQIEQQVKKVAREIRGVDIDQKQLRTAANTARKGKKAGQVTQRTQRMIYRAKQAAGESAEATKKGIAVIRSAIRHWMTAMQSLAAALIAGGWVSVFIILLMCLIALVAGSAYGIFFAAESPDENAISVQEAVELLTEEYRDRLEEIENSVECDRQKIESNDGSYAIVWQDVLAVFASQTEGDANGTTVAYLNEENVDRLRTVLWDMNELDWRTESQLQEEEQTNEEGETETTTITETVLIIELTHHTPEEMRETYHFTDRQNEYLTLLSGEDTAILWGKLLGGLIQGSDELMAPGMDTVFADGPTMAAAGGGYDHLATRLSNRPAYRQNQLPQRHRHRRARGYPDPGRCRRHRDRRQRPRQLGWKLWLLRQNRPWRWTDYAVCALFQNLCHSGSGGKGRAGYSLCGAYRTCNGSASAF